MTTITNVELDTRKGRVKLFYGKCIDELPNCQAMCCRISSTVYPTPAEIASQMYETAEFCLLTNKECEKEVENCVHQQIRLKKKADGSCIYLNEENNLCSIYDHQPNMCKIYFCREGWNLAGAYSAKNEKEATAIKLGRDEFIKRLRDDMIFVLHPLLKLQTIFYLKARREIVFVKELVGTCGMFNSRESFDHPNLNEDQLLGLIDLFNRKKSLGYTRHLFNEQTGVNLDEAVFYEIIWLLNKHNIILHTKNLQGLLNNTIDLT